jgi:tetratricopeptide (TPR) repeat protein
MATTLLALAALAWVAHKTNPNAESFREYYREYVVGCRRGDEGARTGNGGGWFAKVGAFLRQPSSEPSFKYQSYQLYSVVTITDTKEQYLGILKAWFPLSTLVRTRSEPGGRAAPVELESITTTSVDPVTTVDAEADRLKSLAIDAKSKRDYRLAGDYFEQAGRLLDDNALGESLTKLEAASMFEEAAKCRHHTSIADAALSRALQNLQQAAELYFRFDRGQSRAGRIFDQLALWQTNAGDVAGSVYSLERAATCFEHEGDSRALTVYWSLIDRLAMLGKYSQARDLIENRLLSSNDDMMKFRRNELYLLNCWCVWSEAQDVATFAKTLQKWATEDPGFLHSREARYLKRILTALEAGDDDELQAAWQEYQRISPVRDAWKLAVHKSMSDWIKRPDLT